MSATVPSPEQIEAVAREMRAYADAHLDNVINLRRTGSIAFIDPHIRMIHDWAERLGERGNYA